MTKHRWMVDDRLWELIAALILAQPPARGPGGRPRIEGRAALEGILFVSRTVRCRWTGPPSSLGCGSGPAAWRRLREWQEAGIREQLHQSVPEELSEEGFRTGPPAGIDSVSVRVTWG